MNHLVCLAQEGVPGGGGWRAPPGTQAHRCLSCPEFLLVTTPPPIDYVQIQEGSTVADAEARHQGSSNLEPEVKPQGVIRDTLCLQKAGGGRGQPPTPWCCFLGLLVTT